MLTEKDLIRFNRQILFPDFGEDGQESLQQSHVLVAGIGGLGSPVSIYLACAGIGKITLVDSDSVELSNLNRQTLHWENNIGERKVLSAAKKLKKINSNVQIIPLDIEIREENFNEQLDDVSLVIDCLDNIEARFILNKACVLNKIPMVHGGVYGLKGEATTIIPGKTPCFECIFPRKDREKTILPIFGATPSLIASIQVMEGIKFLAGFGELLEGKMLYVNGENMEFMFVSLKKNPDCQICGSVHE